MEASYAVIRILRKYSSFLALESHLARALLTRDKQSLFPIFTCRQEHRMSV